MKVSSLFLLASTASSLVLPDEHTQNILAEEVKQKSSISSPPSTSLIVSPRPCHKQNGKTNGVYVDRTAMEAFHGRGWLKSPKYSALDVSTEEVLAHYDHPHHENPHHRHEPNETIWQLISTSKYTTKLAKLVGEYDDLVSALNSTKSHNYTLFAPTDHAFEKLEKHHGNHSDHKPSKELIKKVLTYHLSNEFYPAGKVLLGHTIPSALHEDAIGDQQRLRVGLGFKGLAVNFYSRIVAVDIFATNGVIHGVDSIILPPPPAAKIIEYLPATFSTFSLAVEVTGLKDAIPKEHVGLTLFAPSNNAFQRLGSRLNAFLFSPYGRKYLQALLKYHIVYNQTLYSDAYYHGASTSGEVGAEGIPKGHYHVDLPTLLADKYLSIDIGRFGGLIDITINGYVKVGVQDGVAKDGVIQVVRNVLVPPKKPGEGAEIVEGEMGVEEFKSRFEGLVEDDGEEEPKEKKEMWDEKEFIELW